MRGGGGGQGPGSSGRVPAEGLLPAAPQARCLAPAWLFCTAATTTPGSGEAHLEHSPTPLGTGCTQAIPGTCEAGQGAGPKGCQREAGSPPLRLTTRATSTQGAFVAIAAALSPSKWGCVPLRCSEGARCVPEPLLRGAATRERQRYMGEAPPGARYCCGGSHGHPPSNPKRGWHHPHFTAQGTEAQRAKAIC